MKCGTIEMTQRVFALLMMKIEARRRFGAGMGPVAGRAALGVVKDG